MATTQRNRKVLNAVMIALAVVVVVAGIAFFMAVRGGQNQSSSLVVSQKIGYANIERTGINYALDEGTPLQPGDIVETLEGSEIAVKGGGESELFLADASKMQVKEADSTPSKASVQLESGCIFADARNAGDPLALEGAGLAWQSGDAVFVSDMRAGTVTVQVLSGDVEFADGTAVKSGESRTVVTTKVDEASQGDTNGKKASPDTTGKLTVGSLDNFALEHALDALAAGRELVFTQDQIDKEIERRETERKELASQAAAASSASASAQGAGSSSAQSATTGQVESSASADAGTSDAAVPASDAADTQDSTAQQEPAENTAQPAESNTENTHDEPAATNDAAQSKPSAPAEDAKVEEQHTCTLQIRCDSILDNMDALAKGKNKYVPKNGILLRSTTMTFEEGESAFDVLQRACNENGIALEYSYVPVYGSYYVEGIGNLYEFDCGDESGWMYKVNGYFPNYGCSEFALSDGDAVVFCYSCKGLGEDVGA